METLIPVINKLQDVFNTLGADLIKLPQIVVVGVQSSGKSSLIEGLVGKSFLPRGTGIITRRPLILQLVYCPKDEFKYRTKQDGTLELQEWGVFLHCKDKIYSDFDEIRKEIEAETNRVAGSNKGVCSIPINLKIYSSHVVNLTLVDLPGITKMPVGDQPEDIEQQLKDLVVQHITNPNAIILAVVTANTDMATSESLKIAKEVDPAGDRTLAVVTKLDLMDSGTDAVEILTGKVIPVKLGIIGVVNRSQQDIIDNKNIEDAVEDETKFLQKKYPTLSAKNGTPYLAKRLNRLLMHHIKSCLPDLKARVSTQLSHYQSLLKSYGSDVIDYNETLLQVTSSFAAAYCSTIDGSTKDIETKELCGGARINYIFQEIFGRTLNSIHPLEGLTRQHILTAIRNANGARPALFVPEVSFELLVKGQIKRLEDPCIRCIELVHEEMQRIIKNCGNDIQKEMLRFPELSESINKVVLNLLHERLTPTADMVKNLIAIEVTFINSKHPDFKQLLESSTTTESIFLNHKSNETQNVEKQTLSKNLKQTNSNQQYRSPQAISSIKQEITKDVEPFEKGDFENHNSIDLLKFPLNKANSVMLSECENDDCDVIERLIKCYFYVVRKTIQDLVPKAIMHFMVDYVKKNLQSELVSYLYKTENSDKLLNESEHVIERRAETGVMLKALLKASQIISEVRETQIW